MVDIAKYDKIMENLRQIRAIAETMSSLSVNEPVSVDSIKTLGYMIVGMNDEVMELLRSERDG